MGGRRRENKERMEGEEKGAKKKRERGKKRGKNMRHDFLEAVKNTCLHGEPRLGPRSDGYTGLICMRPLPPGVPEFAYERVALADFSLLLVPFSLSLSCFRVSVSLSVSFPFCLPLSFTLASVQPPVYAFMGYWLSVSRR